MYEKLYKMMNWPIIEGIQYSDIDNPGEILGPLVTKDGVLVQVYQPDAESVKIKYSGKTYDMYKMDDCGYYAYLIDSSKLVSYKLIVSKDGEEKEFFDPYAFETGENYNEYKKFNAGILYDVCDYMGAHFVTKNRVNGVRFSVWAPQAVRVSVVGEFNNWDGRIHQMTKIGDTDVFEIFIPGVDENSMYKFEIKKKGGENILKADPYALSVEKKPGDASVVIKNDEIKWTDGDWIKNRDKKDSYENTKAPMSVYQINLLNYTDEEGYFDYKNAFKAVSSHAKKCAYNYVEIMPFMEYANENNGYKTDFFYAVTSGVKNIQDLMKFIDMLHGENIGVIVQWNANGFTAVENGLGVYDGTCLYEHSDPKKGWNEKNQLKLFNYGRSEVTCYLLGSAFMLLKKFHVDGIKLMNVASMLYLDYDKKPGEWESNIYGSNENLEAIEFIKHFNSIIHKTYKGVVTIADDNSGFMGITGEVNEECLGFNYKINYNWEKDFLEYMSYPAYMRGNNYNKLSLSMLYQYSDEFIHGFRESDFIGGSSLYNRMAGDNDDIKKANTKLAIAYSYVHPGKKVIFAGQDEGATEDWNLKDNFLSNDRNSNGDILNMVEALGKLYNECPALYEMDDDPEGFEWINNISARECILTFVRKGSKEEDMLLVVCNFEAVERDDYKIGVPFAGKYKEIFNSDSKKFGGDDFVNPRLKQAKADECDGRKYSIRIKVPALGVAVFNFTKVMEKVVDNKTAKANAEKKTAAKTAAKSTSSKSGASAGKSSSEKKTASEKVKETKAAVTKKAGDAKTAVTKKAEDAKKVVTKKAGDAKSAVTKKAEDAKSAVTKKASDAKNAVTKKASDAKTAVTKKSADVKTEDTKAVDVKTADVKTADVKTVDVKTEDTKAVDVKTEDTKKASEAKTAAIKKATKKAAKKTTKKTTKK